MPTDSQFNWLMLLEIGLFVLLAFIALSYFIRFVAFSSASKKKTKEDIVPWQMRAWLEIPEYQLLILAIPIQLLWEIAQLPLFTIWHESDWSYILYALIHCTIGDLLILLIAFWLVSLLNKSRFWFSSPSLLNITLFTLSGLGYTIYSEIINTRIKDSWSYTDLMPIVPIIEIGGMPFLQWLLIPPLLIWLMQLMKRHQ